MGVSAGYVFLDLETTGLTSEDEITEAAWLTYFPGSPIAVRSMFVEHERRPSQWVIENTDYCSRILPAIGTWVSLGSMLKTLELDCQALREAGASEVYLVGSNIAFDDGFLVRALQEVGPYLLRGVERPYHYHLIDVETLAMAWDGLKVPPHTKDLLRLRDVEEPPGQPHQALYDARVAMLAFLKMVDV